MNSTTTTTITANAVHRIVAMAHALDVDASVDFYALLGFAVVSTLKHHDGVTRWARLATPGGAELMLARASGPIDADQQAVLFYMYASDAKALRTHLLASGLADGGAYRGQPLPLSRVAFEITHPPYMPEGEFRVMDPDGYCILVGQLAP